MGAESDLIMRVLDTPPMLPRPHDVARFCPEGVHVLVLVLRADLPHTNTHLEEYVQVHTHTSTCTLTIKMYTLIVNLCILCV